MFLLMNEPKKFVACNVSVIVDIKIDSSPKHQYISKNM